MAFSERQVATVFCVGLALFIAVIYENSGVECSIFPPQQYKSIADIQKAIKAAKKNTDLERRSDGMGKVKYDNIGDFYDHVRRKDPGGYGIREVYGVKPPAKIYEINDPECTKEGKLGCGARCFIPHTYTRCLNGKVMGPELPFP